MTVELEQKLQKRLDEAIANREIQQVGQVQVFGIEKVMTRVGHGLCSESPLC